MPKLEEKKKSKIVLLFLGLLLIKLGIALIVYKYISDKYSTFLEEKAIEEYYLDEKIFYESEKETVEEEKKLSTKKVDKINYIATIKIPKINLEKGLVEPSSDLNNIKYGIQILKDSSMPDKEKSNLILASHSGTARISYFKNLDKLIVGDEVIINYRNNIYTYKVARVYDVNKNGKANLIYNKNKNNLILITCRYKTNKQIILVCELEND
jgi:LPXTG-site transpeptidase (sortase) family protein